MDPARGRSIKKAAQRAGAAVLRHSGRLRLPPGVRADPTRPDVLWIERSSIVNPWGFSYAAEGWHPYVATLEEVERDEPVPLPSTALARTREAFQPGSLAELLFGEQPAQRSILDGILPSDRLARFIWALRPRTLAYHLQRAAEHGRSGGQVFGPATAEQNEADLAALLEVHRSVVDLGYQPLTVGTPIKGYFLVRDEDHRFVNMTGFHRLAVLTHLGIDQVAVRPHPVMPACVSWSDLDRWKRRLAGVLPPVLVERLFVLQLRSTGRERAAHLGLLRPRGR